MEGGWAAHTNSYEETVRHNRSGSFFTTLKQVVQEKEEGQGVNAEKVPEADDGARISFGWATIGVMTSFLLSF